MVEGLWLERLLVSAGGVFCLVLLFSVWVYFLSPTSVFRFRWPGKIFITVGLVFGATLFFYLACNLK